MIRFNIPYLCHNPDQRQKLLGSEMCPVHGRSTHVKLQVRTTFFESPCSHQRFSDNKTTQDQDNIKGSQTNTARHQNVTAYNIAPCTTVHAVPLADTASPHSSQSSRTVMDIAIEQSVSKTDCNIQLSSVNQMALAVSTFRSQHQAAVDLLCTSV